MNSPEEVKAVGNLARHLSGGLLVGLVVQQILMSLQMCCLAINIFQFPVVSYCSEGY